MKVVFYLFFLFLFSKAALAQSYDPIKLFDLASGAEVVTYGTVTKLDEKHYYLDCVYNKKATTFKIQKYLGRPNAVRFAKYEIGQRLFVFLRKVNGEYVLYSPGVESEIPIVRDSLVIDMNCFIPKTIISLAPKGLTAEYKKIQTFIVGNKMVFGLRFSPQYLYQSIMAFNTCYQVLLKRPNTYPSNTCFNFFDRYTKERTNTYKVKFKLMKLMFMDMEEAQLKNCH